MDAVWAYLLRVTFEQRFRLNLCALCKHLCQPSYITRNNIIESISWSPWLCTKETVVNYGSAIYGLSIDNLSIGNWGCDAYGSSSNLVVSKVECNERNRPGKLYMNFFCSYFQLRRNPGFLYGLMESKFNLKTIQVAVGTAFSDKINNRVSLNGTSEYSSSENKTLQYPTAWALPTFLEIIYKYILTKKNINGNLSIHAVELKCLT